MNTLLPSRPLFEPALAVCKLWTVCSLLAMPGPSPADGHAHRLSEGNTRVTVTGGSGAAIRVEASNAPLGQVLEALARETGSRFHYATVPEEPVSVSCVGPAVKEVVECVLGPDANLISRDPPGSAKTDSQRQLTELWILSKGSREPDAAEAAGSGTPQSARTRNRLRPPPPMAPSKAAQLVDKAASSDPVQRLDALSDLAAMGSADNKDVWKTLERALADEDPDARAQAVYGLSRLGGNGAAQVLRDALRDSDASVRLMAVDSAGNDPQGVAVLQEALADSDPTVSALAAMKLKVEPSAQSGAAEQRIAE